MFRMLRVAKDLEQAFIASRPSTILGWAGALACDTDGIQQIVGLLDLGFNDDLVLPPITKVIGIHEFLW